MPFLLAEILNFQGSTHRTGVGSFSDLNKAEERLKKVQKMQSDWDAKQNEKMYLVIPATEHVEVSIDEQKKNIKERLEEKRQEVKKSRGMEL